MGKKCKSTGIRDKDESERKIDVLNEGRMVEKTNQKPPNLAHERNAEYKAKQRNPWK